MFKVILAILAVAFLPQIAILIGIYYVAYRFWKRMYRIGEAISNGENVMGGGESGSSERDGTEFHSTGAPYL